MKKILFSLGVLLISATIGYAEQKIIYTFTQAEWGGWASFLESDCKSYCEKQSSDVNDYLSKGWRVILTKGAMRVSKPFKGDNTYCRCIGSEYVLER